MLVCVRVCVKERRREHFYLWTRRTEKYQRNGASVKLFFRAYEGQLSLIWGSLAGPVSDFVHYRVNLLSLPPFLHRDCAILLQLSPFSTVLLNFDTETKKVILDGEASSTIKRGVMSHKAALAALGLASRTSSSV